jgi:hypothetical protein
MATADSQGVFNPLAMRGSHEAKKPSGLVLGMPNDSGWAVFD